ncbi:SET domain-containing protein [Delitschia confertaspora ATCC 74209]|uniref:SET domain-containing protein n=1 Tax=Delitschia confertaspora ATCC 74209 TaxID=1513339 RepID=A0A9P4JPN8_9PLEO|nr:SET domain-containing protein [Delitschia confertaspora ATCC 74209]
MTDPFQQRSETFLHWLRNSGADISPKIELVDLRQIHAGRGVVAISEIAEDELLFRIPRSSVLSVENSALPRLLPAVFEELDPWLSLILVMIYEWCQGEKSSWKPYFDVLPSEFNTLMFWSEDELNELQASAVRYKIGKEGADEMFKEKIFPVVRQNAGIFGGEAAATAKERDVVALAHRMGSTIMAYAFDIEPANQSKEADEEGYVSEEEDEALPKGMVPLADMLNADADRNNARLFYEENYLSMKAISPIQAGEEIFNDYGPLPRSDLLRRYGYITDNYVKYDVVEISLDMVREAAAKHAHISSSIIEDRLEYLDDQGLIDTGYDITASDNFDVFEDISPELLVLIETLLLPQPEFERLKAKGKLPKPSNLSMKGAQLLHFLVKARTAQFATSLQQDQSEPISLPASGPSVVKARRYAMAKLVRIGEKAILRQADIALANLINKLSSSSNDLKRERSPQEESSKKRRMA